MLKPGVRYHVKLSMAYLYIIAAATGRCVRGDDVSW